MEEEKIVKMDYPSNTRADKEARMKKHNQEPDEPKKKVEKIVTGKVVKRKKTFGAKVKDVIFGDDANSVASYIIYDVLVPAAKSTIEDIVKGGIEMVLFGERNSSNRTRRDRGRSYVSYDNISRSKRDDGRDRRREISNKNRSKHNFDDIVLSSRGEAEEVLSNLVDLILDYGDASVSDLYEMVGVDSNYTDKKYGWDDLSSASVSREREGYLLNLPRPKVLD